MARMGGRKSAGSVATAARTKARATTTRVTTPRAARRSGTSPEGANLRADTLTQAGSEDYYAAGSP